MISTCFNFSSSRGAGTSRIFSIFINELTNSFNVGASVLLTPFQSVPIRANRFAAVLPRRSSIFSKVYTDNILIPGLVRKHKLSSVISFTDTSSLAPGCKHILYLQQGLLCLPLSETYSFLTKTELAKLFLMRFYFRKCILSVDHIVVQTSWMKHALVELWNYPEEAISILPVFTTDGLAPYALIRKSASMQEGNYLFFPCTPSSYKNIIFLLRMMQRLSCMEKSLILILTLDEHDVPFLKAYVVNNGLDNLVKFAGRCDHSHSMYLMSKAFAVVVPSLVESFCLPIYEALAMGCPVFAIDKPYSRESLSSHCIFRSPEEMADAIYSLYVASGMSLFYDYSSHQKSRALEAGWLLNTSKIVAMLD
jgi:glycosyltransferase involved in cell wall biosynthesis